MLNWTETQIKKVDSKTKDYTEKEKTKIGWGRGIFRSI